MLWLLVLVVVIGVSAVAMVVIRRWMRSSQSQPAGGFTLAELKRLREEGSLSAEEFEALKRKVLHAEGFWSGGRR